MLYYTEYYSPCLCLKLRKERALKEVFEETAGVHLQSLFYHTGVSIGSLARTTAIFQVAKECI